MSEIVYAVKKKNIDEGYAHVIGDSKSEEEIDVLTSNFMQELVTDAGSVLFDKDYGTTFLSDIGSQVNIYKVRYLLDRNYQSTKDKYDILSVETSDVFFDKKDGFLNMTLVLLFDGFKSQAATAIQYDGSFTTNTIIEVEK